MKSIPWKVRAVFDVAKFSNVSERTRGPQGGFKAIGRMPSTEAKGQKTEEGKIHPRFFTLQKTSNGRKRAPKLQFSALHSHLIFSTPLEPSTEVFHPSRLAVGRELDQARASDWKPPPRKDQKPRQR